MLSNHQFARNVTAKISTAVQINQVSQEGKQKKGLSLFVVLCLLIPLPLLKGCDAFSKTKADAQRPPSSQREGGAPAVDVAIAKTDILEEPLEYIGRTQPIRDVLLRAQVEGRLHNLQVDVGDPVKKGQILAQLDDSLLQTSITQGEAELAALQSEVARAQTQVQNARAQAEQARAELKQAQVDAARMRSLASSGAIPQQQAEVQQTEAATAQQTLNAAIAQIATEQQAVAAAQRRVEAQRATLAQAKERQSYSLVASPIAGFVLEPQPGQRLAEPGDLLRPGDNILRLGDFSSVKVVVQLSDRKLSNIQIGQSVQVSLDAFANEQVTGRVTRISPAGDADALSVPVEIVIPNSNGRIGSGLKAQVSFEPKTSPRVVVPETALQEDGERGRGNGEIGNNPKSEIQNPKSREATVFVVAGEGNQAKVQARRVQVGTSANGNVEILSGLKSGERFVVRSDKPLKDGALVRVSILSRTSQKQEQR